jgi:hypothetical protein
LHPKDPPAEATIPSLLPVLSDHDSEGSDEGSNEGNDEVEELDGDAPDDDGDDDPGFDYLPDEEDDDNNNVRYDDGSLPPHRVEIRCPVASYDEESDGENDSVGAADNVLEEDELEPTIDDDDDEVGLNRFEVEDLDDHGRKWQAYLAEKEALLASNFSVEKSPNAVKFGVGVRVQEKGGEKRNGIIVEQISKLTWMVQFDAESDPDRKTSSQVKTIIHPFVWRMQRETRPINPPKEYRQIGLAGFYFDRFSDRSLQSKDYSYPFLDLLLRLWPGDWKQQLRNLNDWIDKDNEDRAKAKKVKLVSESDFFKFLGVLISAAPLGKGGTALWEKSEAGKRSFSKPIDLGPSKSGGRNIIPKYRFDQIKHAFPYAFGDEDAKIRGDEWHPIALLFEGFNEIRAQNVAASHLKVLNESMSVYRPRTTQLGRRPHLSFIGRKPEPLGTEFKVSNRFEIHRFDAASNLLF